MGLSLIIYFCFSFYVLVVLLCTFHISSLLILWHNFSVVSSSYIKNKFLVRKFFILIEEIVKQSGLLLYCTVTDTAV